MIKGWNISDNDLVPDDVQNELIDIRSRLTTSYFRIGDIANRLVLEATKAKMRVTAGRVHKAVGAFCGKSARTVRYYAENAAFFDVETRFRFSYLPFSFFDFARNFGNQWEDVMKLAAENPEKNLAWLQKNYSLQVNGVGKESPDYSSDPVWSGRVFEGLDEDITTGFRCAQTDLIPSGSKKVYEDFSPLSNVGVALQPGLTAAEFHFVHEVSYLRERAQLALSMSTDDERVPKKVRMELRYHIDGLAAMMRAFAECIDKPVDEAKLEKEKVGVDIVG